MAVDVKALGAWLSKRARPAPPSPRRAGIDFAALARESYERASPAERARIDAARAEEERVAATRATILARFERLEFGPTGRNGGPREGRVAERWSRDVGIQVEGPPDAEVVRFTDAVTGHESYRLDEDFCRMLEDPGENAARPRFYICAGPPGRWHACSVDPADVAAYLRDRRPELFASAVPSP